ARSLAEGRALRKARSHLVCMPAYLQSSRKATFREFRTSIFWTGRWRLLGMVEWVICALKQQCAHRHSFETQQDAMRVIGDWVQFYSHGGPHQALDMKTPPRLML